MERMHAKRNVLWGRFHAHHSPLHEKHTIAVPHKCNGHNVAEDDDPEVCRGLKPCGKVVEWTKGTTIVQLLFCFLFDS
jgi:hypothetical protein